MTTVFFGFFFNSYTWAGGDTISTTSDLVFENYMVPSELTALLFHNQRLAKIPRAIRELKQILTKNTPMSTSLSQKHRKRSNFPL